MAVPNPEDCRRSVDRASASPSPAGLNGVRLIAAPLRPSSRTCGRCAQGAMNARDLATRIDLNERRRSKATRDRSRQLKRTAREAAPAFGLSMRSALRHTDFRAAQHIRGLGLRNCNRAPGDLCLINQPKTFRPFRNQKRGQEGDRRSFQN